MEAPPRKPTTFPAPPKSALFERLEAFLPKLASENQKLEAAIASGDGDRHNIEVPVAGVEKHEGDEDDEDEEEDDDDGDVAMDGDGAKPPVIEMNFALGLMEEGGSDSESDSDEEEETADVDLATILAMRKGEEEQAPSGITLTTEKPTQGARPLIQEIN